MTAYDLGFPPAGPDGASTPFSIDPRNHLIRHKVFTASATINVRRSIERYARIILFEFRTRSIFPKRVADEFDFHSDSDDFASSTRRDVQIF